ncbi:beta-N-acetylhexosaminidase [Aliidiomarina taiwanensis]|uniref:beta-N-acetylhexosaminidase n=1 Tax=Aliidiomarina taiwanensis TaxID=946228 RepID=A0A432XAK3_9GAMM|nr:beta-N-acetylhexosaminidase [Aliidiomarina taiwanensis]
MIDIAGLSLTDEDKEVLQHTDVKGLILFSRNYASPQQLRQLIDEIRTLRGTNFLITVDHEGGRVQRFREGFSALPPMAALAERWGGNTEQAKQDAYDLGWLMAAELRMFDIDLSYAPVLDLMGESTVIGNRAFSAHPLQVEQLASAFMQGMAAAGMRCVGKHFPGHGTVVADSHIDIPIDDRSFASIQHHDLTPFKALASRLDAVMPAHVIYSEVDPLPAGFSPFWLQQVLRQECQFEGVIISDDLLMEGARVVGDVPARARAAYEAGAELLLVCNNRKAAMGVLELAPAPLARRDAAALLFGKAFQEDLAQKQQSLATLAQYSEKV